MMGNIQAQAQLSTKVDTLTESGAVFKEAQNTFDKMWRRLPDALRLSGV